MGIENDIKKILEDAVEKEGGGVQSRLAQLLQLEPATLHNWLTGKRGAQNKKLWSVLDALGAKIVIKTETENQDNAGGGESENTAKIRKAYANSRFENVDLNQDLSNVKVYSVAGAGPATAIEDLTPIFSVFAPKEYFHMADFAVLIDGRSMEPTIPNKGVVGVRTNLPFVTNELYIARIPYEGLVAKRVNLDPAKEYFIFKSDNPDKEAYPDYKVSIAENENIIVGRIVWIMYGY